MSIGVENGSWLAPAARGPLDARLRVPGSKSLTNRACVLAASASGPTLLRHPLDSRDTRLMLGALDSLGADHEHTEQGVLIRPISAGARQRGPDTVPVDLGNAGTVARFTPALAALGHNTVRFDGDEAIRRRPIGPLLDALETIGVEVDHGGRAAPPFTVTGHGGLPGGTCYLDSSASSQFLSALLLIGPRCAEGITVRLTGDGPPSEPHIAMTLDILRNFGAAARRENDEFHVGPATLSNPDFGIEPDLSTAAPFAVAPLVAGGTVRIAGWPEATTQPGARLRDLVELLGAETRLDADGLTISADPRPHGANLDLRAASELTPVIAALLCLADSPSRITGIAHMRGHETDRLNALATELSALGPRVTETSDGLYIEPAPLHGGVFETYEDHRLVMAGAVLGLAHGGIEVRDPATVGKTFPGFLAEWDRLLA